MGCFDNLIGIKTGCTLIEGTSQLYVEDIGITCQEVDSYINSEYETGQQLVEDKIAFATKIVSKTISNHFSGQFNTRQLLQSQTLGVYQDNLQAQSTVAASYGGINIALNNYSSYLDVFVNSISLQTDHTGTINVLVYNLITGALLDTIVVTTVAGEVSTKYVNKTYSSNRQRLDLIFVYDISSIASYKCQLYYFGCPSCKGFTYSNYYISATPVIIGSASSKIRSSLTNQSHTYGMSVNYSVQCNSESWLCNMANYMALPILYKAGHEIMGYATMNSDRNNSDTNISYEANKERKDFFEAEYIKHINTALENILLPANDICFICSDRVKSKVILP